MRRVLTAAAIAALLCLPACAGPPPGGGSLRGALLADGDFPETERTAARLSELRARGHNALVLAVTDATPAARIEELKAAARAAGLAVYLWINAGRNPELAAAHPEWVGGMGAHEDWRRRFPEAPRPAAGERIGVHPWVPIRYRAVLEDRKHAIAERARQHAAGLAGVFLHGLQAPPSACGCGNDQCRWTVDYLIDGGPEKAAGEPSATLVAHLQERLPELQWIPVWVTECERADQEAGGTGYCASVQCFSGLCWQESTRELEALSAATRGPLALLAASRAFGRDLPVYEAAGGWPAAAIRSLAEIPPAHGRSPVPPGRIIAVVEPSRGDEDAARSLSSALAAGAAGAVVAFTTLDESWEPRRIAGKASP
jgi:hypothetical protein